VALVGVFEVPRIKLTNGLFRTKEKPTSVPTAVKLYDRQATVENRFMQGGSAKRPVGTNERQRIDLIIMLAGSETSTGGIAPAIGDQGGGCLAPEDRLAASDLRELLECWLRWDRMSSPARGLRQQSRR
jgi:hypothetical protein